MCMGEEDNAGFSRDGARFFTPFMNVWVASFTIQDVGVKGKRAIELFA